MTQALQVTDNLTPEQIDLIKRVVCKGATDDELQLFLHYCRVAGFDPLTKQAHFTINKQKCPVCKADAAKAKNCPHCEMGWVRVPTFIAGIDGLLARATEFPDYGGIKKGAVYEKDDFEYDQWEEKPLKHNWKQAGRGALVGAWATVLFKDGKAPMGVWYPRAEYSGGMLSGSMPETMLVKAAMSMALRRAFPKKFSGVYGAEEFGGQITDSGDLLLPSNGPIKALNVPSPQPAATEESASPAPTPPIPTPTAPPEPPPPDNGMATLPWRGGVRTHATDTLDPAADAGLIKRAKIFINPSQHLAAHLKKHYDVERWGQMTYAQAVQLWAHLDCLEVGLTLPADFRDAYLIKGTPTPEQCEFYRVMADLTQSGKLGLLAFAGTFASLDIWQAGRGSILIEIVKKIRADDLDPASERFAAMILSLTESAHAEPAGN